ncbi:hypothetical protein J6S35_00825, partial [Candidatus Saccharibacteria bacterium]|nr:hypothetical protein [Candidatus Saccharibacteria bacterium]
MFYRRSGDGKKALKRKWKQLGMQRSNVRWRILSTGLGVFSLAFLGAFLASSILAPIQNSGATTETATAGGYSLSLSAASSVDLNLSVVDVTDMMSIAETTVTATTTAPNGYKLYVSMNDTSNALKLSGGSATIASTTGTLASPAELNSGEWGFAIPSGQISETNHFDASYVAFENGYSVSQFAGIPASGTNPATLINATSTPNTTTDEFQVYYGLKAKSDTATVGTYTNSVLWTAVADAAQTAGATVSPTSGSTTGGDTITVTSTLFSTSAIDANIYMLTSAAWQDVSANPSHISSYSSMQMSGCTQSSSTPVTYTGCVTPANDEGTGYHVYMDVPRYEKRYNADFTYERPTFWTISNMQDMTPELCASVTKPSSASVSTIATTEAAYLANPGGVVPQRTLIDPRGAEPYKSYTIRKLADGNCWMTDNLALENAALDSTNSNLPENKTVNLPASSTANWCTTNSQACDDQLMTLSYADAGSDTSGHPEYGNYYNWYTATATYGGYNTTTDTSYSIC